MLQNIKPAIDALSEYKGEKTSANAEFVPLVAEKNVRMSMQDIRDRSPILTQLEEAGQIKVTGALYEMKTGRIGFLE